MDSSLRGLSGPARKNQSFSAHLSNRFHAIGYTASFEKHSKVAKKDSTPPRKPPPPKTVYIDGLTERQYVAKCEDEAKLRAIEQQLEELKIKRALKEKRLKQRKENKRRFLASSRIQAAVRSFLTHRRDEHVDVIVSFLRISSNKQAITAAAWATKVLSRFFAHASYKLGYCKAKGRVVKILSHHIVENVNRHISDMAYAKAQEMERVRVEAAAAEEAARARAKKANNRNRLSPSKLQKNSALLAKFKAKRVASQSSPSKSDATSSNAPSSKSVDIVNSSNVPTLHMDPSTSRCVSDTPESTIPHSSIPAASTPSSSSSKDIVVGVGIGTVDKMDAQEQEMEMILKQMAEEEEERQRLLEEAHLKRKLEMESERLQRLKLLEKSKLQREAESRRLKEEEEAAEAEKERKKMMFFKKIMDKQSRTARMMAKIREDKNRKKVQDERLVQRENTRQKEELKHMTIEDKLSKAADLDRVERERVAKKKRKEDALNKAKQDAKAKVDAQAAAKRPMVPRLSAAYRKELKEKEDAKQKFDQLDVDKNGYLENVEMSKLISEVIQPLIDASDLKDDEKASYMASLISHMDTNQDGKLDLHEFTNLWSRMRSEITRKDTGADEINKPWYEKDDHKNSPMAVIYLGVIDEVVYEVVNTEVQEQHIEQERLLKEKERQIQRRVAERIAKKKAQQDAIKAMEYQKKEKMDKVIQVAKKLAQAAPTRAQVRKQQRKKIAMHQKRQSDRKVKQIDMMRAMLVGDVNEDMLPEDISTTIMRRAPMNSRYNGEMNGELGTPGKQGTSEKVEESPSTSSVGDSTITPLDSHHSSSTSVDIATDGTKAPTSTPAPIPPRPPVFGRKSELSGKLERPKVRKAKETVQHRLVRENAMKLKKKEKLGRVASLLTMVQQARKKLGSELPGKDRYANVTQDAEYQEEADEMDANMGASWKKFALLHNDSDVVVTTAAVNANSANDNNNNNNNNSNNNADNDNIELSLDHLNQKVIDDEKEEVARLAIEEEEKDASTLMSPTKFNAMDLSALLKEAGMGSFGLTVQDEDGDDYSAVDDEANIAPPPLDAASLELSEDIMNDCSILTDGSDMGVEIDVDWIRAHAPASKVGLLEGFHQEVKKEKATKNEELEIGSPTEVALRNADSAVSLYTQAMHAATEALETTNDITNANADAGTENPQLPPKVDLELDDLNSETDMVMTGHDEDDEESVASGAYEILVDERQRLLNRLSLQLVPDGISNDALDIDKLDQRRE